jgi:hypothetical protein
MIQNSAGILIINYPGDELADAVTANLSNRDIRTIQIAPDTLGSRQIRLQDGTLYLDSVPIHGMFFRVSPDSKFSDGYQIDDQAFCDAEIRSVLLAALNLESMLAVNKYDATAWFEGLGWPTWRRKLIRAGIPVSEFLFGASDVSVRRVWYPYGSPNAMQAPDYHARRTLGSALTENTTVQKSLVLGKDVAVGRQAASICATAEWLAAQGVYLAEIVSDADDKILTVNTLPMIEKLATNKLVGHQIAEMFYAHLYGR